MKNQHEKHILDYFPPDPLHVVLLGPINDVMDNLEQLVFGQQFQILKEKYALSETLKVHVIKTHFSQYFEKMQTNFCQTNGENLESCHSSLRISEERHGLKMV